MDYDEIRRDKDNFFKSHPSSPLMPEQREHFTGLNYYPPNPSLDLEVPITVFIDRATIKTVSYTHLTLPTILRV